MYDALNVFMAIGIVSKEKQGAVTYNEASPDFLTPKNRAVCSPGGHSKVDTTIGGPAGGGEETRKTRRTSDPVPGASQAAVPERGRQQVFVLDPEGRAPLPLHVLQYIWEVRRS